MACRTIELGIVLPTSPTAATGVGPCPQDRPDHFNIDARLDAEAPAEPDVLLFVGSRLPIGRTDVALRGVATGPKDTLDPGLVAAETVTNAQTSVLQWVGAAHGV
jgi:hypothetical protein